MRRLFAATLLAATFALPVAAQADGSRMPSGGNLMSSYVGHPHHDPRSAWSHANGTGQILGAPMLSEGAGAHNIRRGSVVAPHWAAGTAPSRRAR